MAARILLVDDDPMVLRVVERMLTSHGYTVVAVGSAEAALAELLAPGPFAALVSDLDLGGVMTGFDIADSVAGQLPTILMSGLATEERQEEARRVGALGLIGKPLDFDELFRLLDAAAGPCAAVG